MYLYTDTELSHLLDRPIFRLLSSVADDMGVECYVVGGFVRDLFLQRVSKDIDIVVVGSGIAMAKAVQKRMKRKTHLSVFRNFGTAQLKVYERGERKEERGEREDLLSEEGKCEEEKSALELEFVGARRESYQRNSRKPIVEDGTLSDDQNRRDFTVNALAICLNGARFGELVDPFDGIGDLQRGIMRTPLEPDITFSDDPLRMMRCIRFATQLNFSIDEATFEAICRNAARLDIISGERIIEELNKIMCCPTPSRGLYDLYRSGLLARILPEVCALDIVETRNGRAHKNNFYHTLEVTDNVAVSQMKGERGERSEEREESDSTFPKSGEGENYGANHADDTKATDMLPMLSAADRRLYLRWAALLHDIGKPRSKRWDNKAGWTFHNHNYLGMKMVKPIFRRLKLPMDARLHYVELLVGLHMRPIAIADDVVTDSAVRRLMNDAGEYIDDLMTLCEADITSKSETRKAMFRENFRLVREKLTDLAYRDWRRELQPCIDGNEIMQRFGLSQGPMVGTLKQCLKDAVLDNRVENTREALLTLLDSEAARRGMTPQEGTADT